MIRLQLLKSRNCFAEVIRRVSVAIGSEVSSSIKVPTGNPFFDAGGCGGGCGTGGGCGCKKNGVMYPFF